MPSKCCVVHCGASKRNNQLNLSFHRLPRTEAKKKLWVDAIGEHLSLTSNVICSLHFDENSFNRTLDVVRLRDDAVPSLFLNEPSPIPQFQDLASLDSKVSSISPRNFYVVSTKVRCAVPICAHSQKNSKTSGLTFYSFPKDPDKRQAWIKALRVKNLKVNKHSKICSEHFPETSFYETKNGRKLCPTALPIIILDPLVSATFMMCRICLTHHRDMYNIREFSQAFEQITSISASDGESSRLPQCLCWECAARLTTAASFRAKALLSDGLLRELLLPDMFIRIRDVKTINTKHFGLKSTLIQQLYDCNHFDYHFNDTFAGSNNDTGENNDVRTEIDENKKFENKLEALKISTKTLNGIIEEQITKIHKAKEIEVVETENVTGLNKNNSSNTKTLYVEHNYSNFSNVNDINNENIPKNQQDLLDECVNTNETDSEIVNLSPNDEDMDRMNVQRSNWNIQVEKHSKTITIIPLNLTDNKKEEEKEKPKLKRKMVTVPKHKGLRMKRRPDIRPVREIDSQHFEVTPLTYEQQMLEVEKRQEKPAYVRAPLKCTVCYMGFRNEEVFQRHMLKHSKVSGAFECFICKVRKRSRIGLNQHLTMQHSKEYKCRKCKFVTRFRQVALAHLDFHTGSRFKCEQCDSVFDRSTSYFGHKRLYHMTDIVCELCGFTFISQLGVRNHKAKLHILEKDVELKGPYCKECDVKFLSEEAHDRHLRCSAKHLLGEEDPIRIRNEPPARNIVYRRRINASGLRRRKMRDQMQPSKSTREPYTCEQCGKELCNFKMYSLHFAFAHPGHRRGQNPSKQLTWMCDHCGKLFRSKFGLEGHQLLHTADKGYQCDYCGLKFSQKITLSCHVQSKHLGNTAATKCHLCDKVFSLPNNLKKHLILHKGEHPYECEFCLKRFSILEVLKTHIRHVHFKIPWPKKRRKIAKIVEEE